jgi:imidazolonepropionase-like amidohydrolase
MVAARVVAGDVLLSGAVVHTVAGEVLNPGYVLVRGERIVEVGEGTPEGGGDHATEDLSGLHLYPGLIDAATVLGLDDIQGVRASVDSREVGSYTPEVEGWVSVNPDSDLIPVARANGLTHANIVTEGGVVAGQSGLIQLSGWTVEDLAICQRTGLNIYWPNLRLDLSPNSKVSLDEQDRKRRRALEELDEFFLEARAYAAQRAGFGVKEDRVPAWEAMMPYVRGELPVFVHADEERQIRAVLEWAERRELRVVIFGGREAWRLAGDLASAQVPVVYQGVRQLASGSVDGYDIYFRAPSIMSAAGVKVAISLRGSMEETMARNLPYDAALARAYGWSGSEAIKSVTLYPAEILGVSDRLGSIEAGKEASMVAADGDLLDSRTQVRRVWIAGESVSVETHHTRLYDRYEARPRRSAP